jgi:hypothetical protein
MDTKFYPTVGRNMPGDQWSHRPEHLRENLMRSLQALQADKIDMWYLHGPDRTTPFAETLREVDQLHKEGVLYEVRDQQLHGMGGGTDLPVMRPPWLDQTSCVSGSLQPAASFGRGGAVSML